MVPFDLSIEILFNGSVYDYTSELLFDRSYYCLEMVGPTVESSALVLAYCLGPQKFFDDGSQLSYKELSCNETFVKIGINEAYFNEDHLCISKSHLCYNSNEFCVDNMLKEGENELVTAAFICPYNFINKCCPDGQSLYEHGCMETHNNSLSLIHILKTSRYKIKSISSLGTHCTPVTLEDNTKSDIKWIIDIKGFVIVKTPNQTITTRNFCIDDFTSEHEVFPVIKVCSEEVKVYHEVSSIKDYPDNVLGKCCPRNMYYNSNIKTGKNAQCLERSDDRLNYMEDELLKDFNISSLVFLNFPDCSVKEYYHKYDLFSSYYDYGKITKNRNLEIISKDNNCIRKITEVDRSKFCVDFVPYDERYYKPVAIVCVASRTFHSERNAIVVSLVGISCAALISAFFSIIFMRVRRGMVTVKKINTLAGRILTSYVLSQLVGYLALGIATLADFEEETVKCFVLDALAQLLYFYLPISITVFINAFLLIYAKILRKNKLKKLEKDPNRVRRHENLQQVHSIKSIRSKLKGESSKKPASNHSGLRTHHNRNTWVESLKLVFWSGTTWLMEIIGTLVTMYGGRSQGEWYNYLWYLPVGFNCLRGLGIFVIISFNDENKTLVLRKAKTLRIRFFTTLGKFVPSLTPEKEV
ncbi:hypothetical protein Anas_13390 [Armadillidium nasatum]|uniref:Uncharacterized protein n=1 Tax=Armadillidium nasatum TaxID=96803 RepID=A0A5N5SRB3_9CRUS|nr:hypothetical protein Anas_13390 [Armadillidium nasatum]